MAIAILGPAGALVEAAIVEPWWREFWALYVAPFLVAVPLWARLRLARVERLPGLVLALDAAVVLLAAGRFVSYLHPWSGHALFLTYSALAARRRWYLALAAALFALTTYYKLAVFGDFNSWWWGTQTGAALGIAAMVMTDRAGRVRGPGSRVP